MTTKLPRSKRTFLPVLILSASTFFTVASGSAQTPKVDELTAGLVKIETRRNSKPDDWPGTFDWVADELGTGLVVADSGGVVRVLTAAHVIQGASRITVNLSSDGGTVADARVLTSIDVLDVALLEVHFPNRSSALDSLAPYRYPADHVVKPSMSVWTETGIETRSKTT